MSSFGRGAARLAATAAIAGGLLTPVAGAADLGLSSPILGSGAAPLVGYDAYGYPVYAAATTHVIAPFAGSAACPVGFQPVYDPNGNFAGYGPIRICR